MKICVYCGSGFGKDPAFKEAAIAAGKLLAARKIPLVYGVQNFGKTRCGIWGNRHRDYINRI